VFTNARRLQETKDIETTVAGIRADKVKAEAAEKAAKLKGARMLWLSEPEPYGKPVRIKTGARVVTWLAV